MQSLLLPHKHPHPERSQSETAATSVYTPLEVAERAGLSRRRVYDWLTWGWLRGYRRGGRWVVTGEDWEFFTRACRGARGRLMPSLHDWEEIWGARPDSCYRLEEPGANKSG